MPGRTRHSKTFAVLIAAGLTAGLAACGPQQPDDPVVLTDSGPVRGAATEQIRSFSGIPYAAPPTGSLRWAPPQPVQPWEAPRDATRRGNACPQVGVEIGEPSTTEDCLYLNVTAPRQTADRPLPVMVYLHGGSFVDGVAHRYDPTPLVTRGDVIVVTVNYRLGIFGFLSHPALDAAGPSGDYGLQDQQAALRWVQRNARAFGGDPGNVTLFGESGGGFSVCDNLVSPGSAGLFHRAIVQSAPCAAQWSPETTSAPRPRAIAAQQGIGLATRAGCADEATAADCLRRKPVPELLEAASGENFSPALGGTALPTDPATALESGRFARVPVLHGINRDEERFMTMGAELMNGRPLSFEQYRAEVAQLFPDHAEAVIGEYGCYDDSCASLARSAAITDHRWAKASLDTGTALARWTPTYSYEFAAQDAPWHEGVPKPPYPVGAYHTAELPYLFNADWAEPLDQAQQELADQMIGYWTRFAATGDPNGDGAARWDRNAVLALESGRPGGIAARDFAAEHHYEFWTAIS
ncbi:carboxylesterase family protein [Saccharopolyspora indica]|uniref:carboxylesterase/lipase family protein n=1 Tax=Saccharopolyspora indica TaxID=1229659 RepID=UPI0022EB0705|nr:carboxylesterase family protein [Saccharopolyspora indica]MDA3646558.1 carboxylesterase family protein [Saccharopolyspora indica]